MVRALYRSLLRLYPGEFREHLFESMEQTFQDLCNEKIRAKEKFFGFVLWTFIETAIGIVREHLLLVSPGAIMRTTLNSIGIPGLISLLIILPFIMMEIVNRRHLSEDFPAFLFLIMWLNLFAISLILLPIVRSRQARRHDMTNPVSTQANTLLTDPKSAAIISVILILSPFILAWLDSLPWVPLDLDRLFNGSNPEVPYLPGQIIALAIFAIPIAAGIIAGGPIARSLRAGGSLFAYPTHLIILALILLPMAIGLVSLIIDQWPCFMGVPNCD